MFFIFKAGIEHGGGGNSGSFHSFTRQEKLHVGRFLSQNLTRLGPQENCGLQYKFYSVLAATIQRNPRFATLNSDDISYFKALLGDKNVIQDEDTLLAANTDWMHKYRGSSKLMLQPRSTEEVPSFHFSLHLNIPCSIPCLWMYSLEIESA